MRFPKSQLEFDCTPVVAGDPLRQPLPCAGRMAASKVGSDNVMGSGSALNERRTSSSLLLDVTVTLQHAALRRLS